jgi:hypothetical protein
LAQWASCPSSQDANRIWAVFGLTQIIWFIWLGIVLLRSNPAKKTANVRLSAA